MGHYLLPQILHWSGRALWSSELAIPENQLKFLASNPEALFLCLHPCHHKNNGEKEVNLGT